ncbi:MAG TPA: DUF4215 domain-containing protein [Kofleriaceae bacterium]|nr:DUF4215 domain-containing protein [Kofleriaceae bacterium]
MRHLGVLLVVFLCACGDNIKQTPQDAGADGPELKCGNGVLDGNEECDDGEENGITGARCDTTCKWVCLEDLKCSNMDPCDGEETCVDHRCVAGTDVVDGTTCGTGKLCRNAVCTDAVCGDQFVTGPAEECDDANSTQGDGCDNNCKLSCVSTDSTRNCTPADACAGQGTCNDSTHACTAGTPLANNTACGTGGYCKAGVCTQPVCGNGMIEPGEVCDDGTSNGQPGDGCKSNCQYVCVNAAADCPAAAFCQMNTCTGSHTCAAVADPAKENMTCGSNLVCKSGACTALTAVCGNGTVETGEQCDFGGSNGAGTGCETSCQFSCQTTPTDTCNDSNACNGTETCGNVTVNARTGKRCSSTAPLTNGTSCGTNQICLSQVCVTSSCGDSFVDSNRGETCDPPGGTCDASCHAIACGDGVRAGTEQCDDSNTTNLDGCDSSCKFEQCHRVNSLSIAFPPSNIDAPFCAANALGGAVVGGTAQNQLGAALTSGVRDGSITIELKALGLTDLTGTSGNFTLGALTGTPVTGTSTYNGTSDLDWWYTTAANVIDGSRNPTTTIPASITAKNLTTTPTEIVISVSLGGQPATLDMLNAKLKGNIGAANTPLTSTGGPPGHLASEHLDPTLTSFATVSAGELCGDVTAQSLYAVPIPTALVGCSLVSCSACYTASNTLLDVIVNGCNTLIGQQIKGTQPDKSRVTGTTYSFVYDNTTKTITGCTKKVGMTTSSATLTECRQDSAYSTLLRFTTDRVIAK